MYYYANDLEIDASGDKWCKSHICSHSAKDISENKRVCV